MTSGFHLMKVIEPDELFTICIDSAMEIPEIDMIGVYLLNKKNHIYELKYNVGGSPDFVEKVKTNQFRTTDESILGGKQPRYRDIAHIEKSNNMVVIEEGIKSFCIIPIIVDNQVIGAFNVASRNYTSISKQTGNILELISSQLGTTLHKIWSREKIKLNENRLEALLELTQMNYESENEIYNFALEKGVQLTKSTHGFIAHVDPENHYIFQMRIWSIHAKQMGPVQDNIDESSDVLCKGIWSEIIQNEKTYHSEQ